MKPAEVLPAAAGRPETDRAAPDALRIGLTPAGARHAFSRDAPDALQQRLQAVLSDRTLPLRDEWCARSPEHAGLLDQGLAAGWLHLVPRRLEAPDARLFEFLPHVIAGLSGERRAALASVGGFCVGHAGYTAAEAEALCVAAADFTEFARRQRARGWDGASDMTSFHKDVAMLIPSVSFVPFWVDGTDFCLVLGGEPLLNSPAFVELIWGIKSSGARYAAGA